MVRSPRRPGEGLRKRQVRNTECAIYEHNFKANGNWLNWLTCLRGIEDSCPACEELGENNRYYVGYYSVVDTSKWTDKRGNEHQFEMQLLPAKLGSLKKFRRKKQDRIDAGGTGLAGCLFRCTRDTDKEPSIGGEFEFIREVDMEKLFDLALYKGKKISELFDKAEANPDALKVLQKIFKVDLTDDGKPVRKIGPFNYVEVLHPLSMKDQKAALSGASTGDSGSSSGGASADESVPF